MAGPKGPKQRILHSQRRALREWVFGQQPRPSQKATSDWFFEQFGFRISQSTISESLSARFEVIDQGTRQDGTRLRASQWPDLEKELFEWHQRTGITNGDALREQAAIIWRLLPQYADQPAREFSNGWLMKFKKRHDISGNGTKVRHADDQTLIKRVMAYVSKYMANFDGSHDYAHVTRVVGLARTIAAAESAAFPSLKYDEVTVTLAALMHDVGDRKYLKPGEFAETQVTTVLLELGATAELADKIQAIVSAVSYSAEIKDPQRVRTVISRYPELAVVQDADRLDAIGAIGIGRTFTFGGAKGSTPVEQPDRAEPDPEESFGAFITDPIFNPQGVDSSPMPSPSPSRRGRGMQETIQHFTDKLEQLEWMMKTVEGKKLARERTERLKMFRSWWDEEQAFASKGSWDVRYVPENIN